MKKLLILSSLLLGTLLTHAETPAELSLRVSKAQTAAFYSKDVQDFIATKPSWQGIQVKVQEVARKTDPQAFEAQKGTIEALSNAEREIYKKAYETAASNQEIKTLRQSIVSIQNSIELLMETLTPGYKEVREKLQGK